MHILRDVPIRRKLTIINMVISGAALLLACLALMSYELVTFRSSMVSDLAATAAIIGDNSSAALTFDDRASAEQTLRSLSTHPSVVGAAIYGRSGAVFATYQRAGLPQALSLPPAQPDGYRFAPNGLELFQKFELAGETAGTVYIVADLGELYARMRQYALILIAVLLAAGATAFLLSAKLQVAISGPVSHLARVVNAVTVDGDYSVRAARHGEDELGRLIDGFNLMLKQIETQDRALQEARDHLEIRVRERTSELDATNRQLLAATERANELAQQALAASRAKSEFLANMSHEIRTPMNGILGTADLLLDAQLSAEQSEYATTIRDSGRALLTILNDILDFSKVEAGKLELEHTPVDVRSLLLAVERLMSVQTSAKALELVTRIDPAVPELISGDPARLRQVLINLCGNAVKFTEAGHVTLAVQVIAREAGSATLRFEVCDTGIGIPPERVNALFQPFSQADSSTTRRYGGTGLGLTIVKRLVELMGGSVGVETQVGSGSTFWFTARFDLAARSGNEAAQMPGENRLLVVAGDAGSRQQPQTQPRMRTSSPRILLAEDNPVNQLVAVRTLEKMGYEVDKVSNGQAAVEAWEAGNYQLILMDCQMPVLDGYEATREIRRRERSGQHIPIVALTAHAMKDDDLKCKQAGMDDYLTKPIVRQRLADCLQRFLGAESLPDVARGAG